MVRHAKAASPYEACGLFIHDGSVALVYLPLPNTSPMAYVGYVMDVPVAVRKALAALPPGYGWGGYHTHVWSRSAAPSSGDLLAATDVWATVPQLIYHVPSGTWWQGTFRQALDIRCGAC